MPVDIYPPPTSGGTVTSTPTVQQFLLPTTAGTALARSGPTALTVANATMVTAPATGRARVVRKITLTNTTAAAITVTWTIAGVSMAPISIPASATFDMDSSIVLVATETLAMLASAAGVNATVSYFDISTTTYTVFRGGPAAVATNVLTTVYTATANNTTLSQVTIIAAAAGRVRVDLDGVSLFDSVTLAANQAFVIDGPIAIPNGGLLQINSLDSVSMSVVASGYVA